MITFEITNSSWATLNADGASPPEIRRDIIAIGASGGGLTATCRLLGNLPDTFDSAVLIALDMGSLPAVSVLQVLSCYCRLPISYATDGALVRRRCVLVAPTHFHLRVTPPGVIKLEEKHSFSRTSPCVDRLFESCATTYGQRVIGVVLSGGSHDGAAGLKRIEAAGGIGIVQRPEDAIDPSMPAHAKRSALPSYCSTIDGMAPLISTLTSDAPCPEGSSHAEGADRPGASGPGQLAENPLWAMSRMRIKQRLWPQPSRGQDPVRAPFPD